MKHEGDAGADGSGAGDAGAGRDSRAVRDPGLQPERTALSWRRTIMSAVVADLLIWRGWLHALNAPPGIGVGTTASATGTDIGTETLFQPTHSAQVVGLGVCVVVASLTTIVLVFCAMSRIRTLHAGGEARDNSADLAVSTLTLRTASTAIVALALAVMGALVLGF